MRNGRNPAGSSLPRRMATRNDVSPRQWLARCDAPLLVALAVFVEQAGRNDLIQALAWTATIVATVENQPADRAVDVKSLSSGRRSPALY